MFTIPLFIIVVVVGLIFSAVCGLTKRAPFGGHANVSKRLMRRSEDITAMRTYEFKVCVRFNPSVRGMKATEVVSRYNARFGNTTPTLESVKSFAKSL